MYRTYCTLYIQYCSLYIAQSTLHRIHCTVHTVSHTLLTIHNMLVASHFICQQVCLATGLSPAPGPEKLLLAWARSAPGLEAVTDLEGLWCDGTALCRLALSHGVAPLVLTAALDKPPDRRITTVLQTLQTSRLLPPGMLDQQVPLFLSHSGRSQGLGHIFTRFFFSLNVDDTIVCQSFITQ